MRIVLILVIFVVDVRSQYNILLFYYINQEKLRIKLSMKNLELHQEKDFSYCHCLLSCIYYQGDSSYAINLFYYSIITIII